MAGSRASQHGERAEGQMALVLSGEIDLAAAPVVADRLAELSHTEGDLVVDAARLCFIDVAGCRVLLEAADRLAGGSRLVVRRPPASLVRVMRVCGWSAHPRLVLQLDPAG
jgi:anti-anti-sigma factor